MIHWKHLIVLCVKRSEERKNEGLMEMHHHEDVLDHLIIVDVHQSIAEDHLDEIHQMEGVEDHQLTNVADLLVNGEHQKIEEEDDLDHFIRVNHVHFQGLLHFIKIINLSRSKKKNKNISSLLNYVYVCVCADLGHVHLEEIHLFIVNELDHHNLDAQEVVRDRLV